MDLSPTMRRLLLTVAAGMAAMVFGGVASPARAAPGVSAPAAIAVEPATGDVAFSRNASQRRPIASTTKLMTALVTLEHARLEDRVTTIPYNGLPVESTGGFRGGERTSIGTLLRAMLVASANDAAATLAVRIGGSRERFVAMMNARARKAGLSDTHFANPIGLDAPGNYSSATDLVKIALLLRRYAFIRDTTDKKAITITSGGRTRTLRNRNLLIGREPFANGLKTGHTQGAGWVLVGSGTRDGVTLVTVVLGAASEAARISDTLALMRDGFRHYQVVPAVTARREYAKVKLKGRDETVGLVASRAVAKTVRRGMAVSLRPAVPAELDGPLAAGGQAGELEVVYDGRVAERVPLVTTVPVAAAPGTSLLATVAIIVLVLAGIALCTLAMIAVRRRRTAGESEARTA